MKFTPRSTPPVIVCAVALAIGAMAGCTGSEPVASDTLPTVPDLLAATTTAPATTTPATTPTTAVPSDPPATPAPPNPEPTTPPTSGAPTPKPPPAAPPNEPPTGGGDGGNTTMSEMTAETIFTTLGITPQSMDVLAWGDVDGDGDADAVIMVTECGASCGSELILVIDDNSTPTIAPSGIQGLFGPWYNGGGASPSSVHSVVITPGTVTLVGSLCGNLPESGNDASGTCNPATQRTATYQYADGTVSPVSIDPPVG